MNQHRCLVAILFSTSRPPQSTSLNYEWHSWRNVLSKSLAFWSAVALFSHRFLPVTHRTSEPPLQPANEKAALTRAHKNASRAPYVIFLSLPFLFPLAKPLS
jgi:hypothetical protein